MSLLGSGTMFPLLGDLRKFLKIQKVHIDGTVFRLHTSATVALLLAFCTLLTAKEYVGTPIDCFSPTLPNSLVNSFCWIESTYSVVPLFNASRRNSTVYPGVGHTKGDEKDRKYHVYYQWVCFLLFSQSIFFYTPRWLWKSWEGGKVPAIVSALDVRSAILQDRSDLRTRLVDFLVLNLNRNNWYFAKYLFCELLTVINVVAQLMFTNYALGGGFFSYGSDVIQWQRHGRHHLSVNPMVSAFPRVAMCSFVKYGQSGSLENREVICILPLNILNEKIFLFIWFWYVMLIVTGILSLLYRCVLVLHAPLRCHLLQLRFPDSKRLVAVVDAVSIGDVFLLALIGQNVDSLVFSELVSELSRRVLKASAPPAEPYARPMHVHDGRGSANCV